MLDMVLNMFNPLIDKAAAKIGRNPQDIRNAINSGKAMLPEIIGAAKSSSLAARFLKGKGMSSADINNAINKYGHLGAKIGLSESNIRNMAKGITEAMDNAPMQPATPAARPQPKTPSSGGFNKKKYTG
jgi:hypothetical protein